MQEEDRTLQNGSCATAKVKTGQVPHARDSSKTMPAWGTIDSFLKKQAEAVGLAWSSQNKTDCGAEGPHGHC